MTTDTEVIDPAIVNDGEVVTVKALWDMPGIAYGRLLSFTMAPDLRKHIAAGRFAIVGAGLEPLDDDRAAGAPGPVTAAADPGSGEDFG